MSQYHKITTLWKRESEKPHNMMVGTYALPEFELLKDIEWTWTEKVDGTNVRVMWDGDKVRFGGKTDNAQMPIFLLDKLDDMFGGEAMEQVFEQTFGKEDAVLYGEGFGAKIQKGGGNYISDGVDFALFDVRLGNWWLQRKDVEDIAKQLGGIRVVPVVGVGTLKESSDFASKPFKSAFGDAVSEGIIAKPTVELFNRKGERIITKLKLKDFEKLDVTEVKK